MLEKQPHVFIPNITERGKFKSSGGGKKDYPVISDRIGHADRLISKFDSIRNESARRDESLALTSLKAAGGTYMEFMGTPGFDFPIQSLEDKKAKIRLAHSSKVISDKGDQIRAILFVPRGSENKLLDKLKKYRDKDNPTKKSGEPGGPKNAPLVTSIKDIEAASLKALWQDPLELMPEDSPKWCEIWLRDVQDDHEAVIQETYNIFKELGAKFSDDYSCFREAIIFQALMNRQQLTDFIYSSAYLSEYRIAQDVASTYYNKSSGQEAQQANQLSERIILDDRNVSVVILDSGVNNGHVLLRDILNDKDCISYKKEWGTDDHESYDGHGTPMAGIVAYNNLIHALESTGAVELKHRLFSVKIYPPENNTAERNYGPYTQGSMALAEGQMPDRRLVFCMAVTTNFDIDQGRPSSWSADIDDYTSGRIDEVRRLIIISSGNLNGNYNDYPSENKQFTIRNPAQAWNALTIGAITELTDIKDTKHKSYKRLAERGQLSPFSSTSYSWKEKKKWPIKPDVVFEGGNVVVHPELSGITLPDLSLLTTSKDSQKNQFALINATSAAAAQASWMAARLWVEYPNAWPETIRGLIIHSAIWSDEIIKQFGINLSSKNSIAELLRIVGYGKPDLEKALYSAGNYLTLIAQQEIQPFAKVRKESGHDSIAFNDVHYYNLIWPKEELQDLGPAKVKLKVTLSYFIEPSPENIGHTDRYRYSSFALRFKFSKPNEEFKEFKIRVNKALKEEEGSNEPSSFSHEKWTIGEARNLGSIHSDFIEMTAADLAACNHVAVLPISGWWRTRVHLGSLEKKARYSLIVSIETPEQEVDIYTAVKVGITL